MNWSARSAGGTVARWPALVRAWNADAAAQELVCRALCPYRQRPRRRVTGSPGSGKSTLVRAGKGIPAAGPAGGYCRRRSSSPFSGGACWAIASVCATLAAIQAFYPATWPRAAALLCLARATAAVVKLLDAAGFDVILVETVGAGQAEVDIANMAHTTLVVEAPGMGDDIQSIKAGILEIADVLVVNKADRPGAGNTVKVLRMMLHMGQGSTVRHHGQMLEAPAGRAPAAATDGADAWTVRVYETVATSGEGVEAVVEAIERHREHLQTTGKWAERERDRSRHEIAQLLQARLMAQLEDEVPAEERERLIAAVASREIDPYAAVDLFSRA